MILPRRLLLLVSILLTGLARAQQSLPAPNPGSQVVADERAARVAERYKAMLLANPVEGLALDRLWKSYDERGASAALVEEYRRLADSPDAGFQVMLIHGHLLRRAGLLDDAETRYQRAEKKNAASPLPTLARAELVLARSHAEEAAGLFGAALEKLPAGDRRNAEVLTRLGAAWIAAGQPLKAAEAWEKTVASDPANVGLRRQLAEAYEKNGLPERAVAHDEFLAAHADPATRATALRDLSRLHEARGEFDAARDCLERGLALTARDNWLHGDLETRIIRLYQRAGRVAELEARWRGAAETAPRDLGAALRMVALAEAQGDLVAQRVWLEKLVALAPREQAYTLRLARRLGDDGDRARAAPLYDGLLKGQPDSLDLLLARAELDLQLGLPAAAVDRIEARVARNPADESVTTPALAFFLGHHLDAAAEKRLRADATRQPIATEPALALSKFLFAQRKPTEARAVLGALTGRPGDPAVRAARWTQAAETFAQQNLAPEALQAWQETAFLLPRSAAPLLAAGDFLLARGDKSGSAAQLRRAAALLTGQDQIDAERKLFAVLQSTEESGGEPGEGRRLVAGAPGTAERAPIGHALGEQIAEVESAVRAAPTSDHLTRLARWQSWARLSEPALVSATRAIAADPANLPARELAVEAATELHRPAEAEAGLQELAARDPVRKNGYLRRLARVKIDAGDLDEGIAILTRVQQEAPDSRELLTDLALAQQRADHWYDALATWERLYALRGTTPAQIEEARRPLLAAYERLGQFPRAADLLRAAVDEQADGSARIEHFRQLAVFCHRHNLGTGLSEDYEKRLAARPDDFFLLTAVAELRRAGGEDRAAYALLQRAYYSSPDPARTLGELVEQAAQLGDDAEAVAQQRRLVALPAQGTAANLEKLAVLEDADLDDPAATRTWENVVTKFPRDTAALAHAADFFQNGEQPERARGLLRQLVEIDRTDTRRLWLLGALDEQAGDVTAARAHFELLLARTTPEAAGEPLSIPPELEARGAGRSLFPSRRYDGVLRGERFERSTSPAVGVSDERRLRLQTIESLSRLLFPKDGAQDPTLGEARSAWLRRWQAAAEAGVKSEPLAAFYFSAQREPTMDLLEKWVALDDATGEAALSAFLNAGLRVGGYRQLARWAWHDEDGQQAGVRGQRLLTALQSYLNAGGKPGPAMVAELFPPEVRVQELLWAAAQNGFAAGHWYAQAAQLGERVLATAVSSRAGYGVQVAEWELYAGSPGRALTALRQATDDETGDSLEMGNPVFAALRSYYLMLPAPERAGFVAVSLGQLRPRNGPARAALAATLLHGLSGDEDAARRDLDELLALRMLSTEATGLSPDVRRWTYLLANGQQLVAWHLDSLAIHLWRRALEEAGALDLQASDADNTVTEVRKRLACAEAATAPDPQQARERLQEFLAAQPEPAAISSLANQLWTEGQRSVAARLYEILCQTDPANTDYWPNLFQFYQSAGEVDAAERLLAFMLAGARALPTATNRAELVCLLASLREKRGDAAGACRLLARERQTMPGNMQLDLGLAETYERAGQWDAAAAIWRESLLLYPGHAARLGLAANEEQRGQRAAAVETLRAGLKNGPDPERTGLVVRLARLLLADHRAEEARQLAFGLLEKGELEPLAALGAAFAENGERTAARELLSAAVLRTHEPAPRFRLQQALAEQYAVPGEDPANFVRQMRRLEKFAQASDGFRNEYDALLYPLAHRQGADGWLEDELKRDWKRGKGDPAAGAQLAGLYLQNHRDDALREVVQTIDRRADLPETLLHALATSLVETEHAPLALALCERLAKRFPQKAEYQLERGVALWKSDRRDEANQTMTALAQAAPFRDGVLESVAAFYLQRGERSRATAFLKQIVENDPAAAHSPQSWLHLAGVALDEGRVADAKKWLLVAYARPACDDLGPLVRYLKDSGQLDGEKAGEMPAREFPLTFGRRARLLAAVRAELDRGGRAEEGRRLLETYAEFLGAIPEIAAERRGQATPATVRTIAQCLERAASQRALVPVRLGRELALLYSQWAVWDANDPSTLQDALAHLSRARELMPDDFAVAGQLTRLFIQEKQPRRAAEVMAPFLTPEALPAEREQAQRLLQGL